jgi:hypothetical protein
MRPSVWFPPTTPLTFHLTPVFELPLTTAAYCDEVPNVTVVAPVNVRVGGGGGGATSITVRLCVTELSATLVAVIVTCDELGSTSGAV